MIAVLMLVLGLASPASAQDIDVGREVGFVKAYFSGMPASALRDAQDLLHRQGEKYQGSIDGKWGAQTERAFYQALQLYIAIGGSGSDWGVNSPKDTARFMDWLAEAASATENGTEFAD